MRVSVIIPVRNEAASIRQTLQGLLRQEFPTSEYELLVVDGRSDDSTPEVIRYLQRSTSNLYLLDNPKRLASSARNVGIRHARGDYIVIVDGHCQIHDPQFLTRLVSAFESSGADTLGRPQPLRAERPTPFQLAVAAARSSWLGHNPDSAIYSNSARFVAADNVAVAYRREVFDRLGLFDESFDACEDVEFNTRVRQAGLTCYFTPAIAVEYQPRASLHGLVHQMMRYGRGRAKLARKHPRTISLASLVPPLWLVWLVLGLASSVLWAPAAWTVSATIVAYALVVFAESVRVWQAKPDVSLRKLPLVFGAIHAAFGFGYLLETTANLSKWPATIVRGLLSQPTQTVGRE
jgi:succinoglycan biosynthesis protein ExoA